jgi:hypothetical protein
MATPGMSVTLESGKRGVLASGKAAVFNADGECPACCPQGCNFDGTTFRFITWGGSACMFGVYIDTTVPINGSASGTVSQGAYSWNYTITCTDLSDPDYGVDQCNQDWPDECNSDCCNALLLFTLEVTAHGPGCEGEQASCDDFLVTVERNIDCNRPPCSCPHNTQLISPDGSDDLGPYKAGWCGGGIYMKVYAL